MIQNTEGKMTLKKALQQIRPVSSETKKAAASPALFVSKYLLSSEIDR